ncbi:MAG: DUF6600 domain-containing protein, partial [Acidobacteriota bacterium]
MVMLTARLNAILRSSWRCLALAFACGIALALVVQPDRAMAQADDSQYDPPARVGRVAYISGAVSYHTLDMDHWEPAVLNYPVAAGDSYWTEPGARTAIEIGHGVLRLDGSTEADVQQLDDTIVQVNLVQGSINFRLRRVWQGERYEILTPSGTVVITIPGRYHIDAFADGRPANIVVIEGSAAIVGQATSFTIAAGQASAVVMNGPPPRAAFRTTEIDTWSDQQEARFAAVPDYVSPEIPGINDVAGVGEWGRSPDYGTIWYPPVAANWAPYRYGHWAFVAPWGWTWVDDAPWGFAPFHYGRWVQVRERWGWVPGEVVQRPVYAPALVVFIGGPAVSIGVSAGPVAAWIPLGPREVYVPPYRTSINYVRNVNVTNVTNVTTINNTTINNITVNRTANNFVNASATTVVPAATMSNSTPVARAAVRVPPQGMERAPVTREAPVKPSLATRGATPAVVQAVGGAATAVPQRPNAPGPAVKSKPLPPERLRPIAPAAGGAPSGAPGSSPPATPTPSGATPPAPAGSQADKKKEADTKKGDNTKKSGTPAPAGAPTPAPAAPSAP